MTVESIRIYYTYRPSLVVLHTCSPFPIISSERRRRHLNESGLDGSTTMRSFTLWALCSTLRLPHRCVFIMYDNDADEVYKHAYIYLLVIVMCGETRVWCVWLCSWHRFFGRNFTSTSNYPHVSTLFAQAQLTQICVDFSRIKQFEFFSVALIALPTIYIAVGTQSDCNLSH